jgi:hypothetical protein
MTEMPNWQSNHRIRRRFGVRDTSRPLQRRLESMPARFAGRVANTNALAFTGR